jgi:probable selenium-dependent hydroxylase accessory protein YqeC
MSVVGSQGTVGFTPDSKRHTACGQQQTTHENRVGNEQRGHLLQTPLISLTEALAIGAREHVALVGAGGKTTLMFALASELRRKGKRLITSTTTKVWHEQALQAPGVVFAEANYSWMEKLKAELATGGHVFLGRSLIGSGKVDGIVPSLADKLFQQLEIDYLLVEADGSAGRPVKAPAPHEPVIPGSVTEVVAVMGLEAIGRKLEPEVVFRHDLVANITGLHPGEELSVDALSRLFLHPEGLFKGSPTSAKRVVFLNKLDLLPERQKAALLADLILSDEKKQVVRVVIGSLSQGSYFIRGV